MHRDLQIVIDELAAAEARLGRLSGGLDRGRWLERPAAGGWSAAECVAHLDLTSEAFLPVLREGLRRAEEMGKQAPGRLRRDPLGWLIWRASGPGAGIRSKTSPGFVPLADLDPKALIDDFGRLQRELVDCVHRADGLPVGSVKIASPFDPRVRYSLYSAFTILAAHQHRHLAQAERAAGKLSD